MPDFAGATADASAREIGWSEGRVPRVVARPVEGVDAVKSPLLEDKDDAAPLVTSRKRVIDHGEVFTPPWLVDSMLDLVKNETDRIDARFLEPACGSGNFLVPVLRRKLAAATSRYGVGTFEQRHFALLGLMCVYGIELLSDNVEKCRAVLLDCFSEHLLLDNQDKLYSAARYVLGCNIIHGDALKMQTHDGLAICFAEWGYLGGGRYQRRDFRYRDLATTASNGAQTSFLGEIARHQSLTPTSEAYRSMTIGDLAALAPRSFS